MIHVEVHFHQRKQPQLTVIDPVKQTVVKTSTPAMEEFSCRWEGMLHDNNEKMDVAAIDTRPRDQNAMACGAVAPCSAWTRENRDYSPQARNPNSW
jgi:hypothetical protein